MRIAVYPGSFDPVTFGHLDIIRRAANLFDRVIVAALPNGAKHTIFTLEERCDMLRRVTQGLPNVDVDHFDGLLAEYVKKVGACAVVKGLRCVADYEYEFQLSLVNRKLNEDFESVFLMTSDEYMYLSSLVVRDVGRHGGDISKFVPSQIVREVEKRTRAQK